MAASAFLNALHADGPAADREGKMDLYGWLIGSWELDVSRYLFVNAMTTVSAVVFLYSPQTMLASVAIVNLDEAGDIGAAAAMATLVVATSALVCAVYHFAQAWLDRRTQAWRHTGDTP